MTPVRRAAPEPGDAGFTLIEMLVAMLLTSIVLAMAGTFYINVAKLTSSARVSREGLGQAEIAVDAVRAVVTMASDNPTSQSATTPAIVAASGTSVTVISYANTTAASIVPSQFTFTVDSSGYLTQTQQTGVLAPTGYWAFSGATTTRRIGGPYTTASGTPFFSYVNASGTVMVPPASGLASSDLPKVAFVRVTAKVAAKTSAGVADPIVITSSIGLTNVYRDVAATTTLPALTGGQ